MKAEHPYEKFDLLGPYVDKRTKREYYFLRKDGSQKAITKARYKMSVHLDRLLEKNETVDHKNNDCTDDRLENLHILNYSDNTVKDTRDPDILSLTCPMCTKSFLKTAWELRGNKRRGVTAQSCCSQSCAKKQYWKLLKEQS